MSKATHLHSALVTPGTPTADAVGALLAQHEHLDRLLSDVWILARAGASGTAVPGLRDALVALKMAFLEHEAEEERLLKPLIDKVLADGPIPLDYLAVHRTEVNDTLCHALDQMDATAITQLERTTAILAFVRQLREHLRREERDFRIEIASDHYSSDGFGG